MRPAAPVPRTCPPCERLANAHIRADVDEAGNWVLGTTDGDPATVNDDDKRLLYGFERGGNSQVGTTFTTVRVVGPSGAIDFIPQRAVTQTAGADRVQTLWQAGYGVVVTETLSLAQNPFTGRIDALDFAFEARNSGSGEVDVGFRTLLDVKLGENDGAPYFVPGVGALTAETEFVGIDVPPFWQAFEDPSYDPAFLRSVGILRGTDVTTPDRFVIAHWPGIEGTDWAYPISASQSVTRDSAVALYWEPVPVAPGQRRLVHSRYGVGGGEGGSAFLSSPLEARCGDELAVALFVNNFETVPLTGGQATLALPAGLGLAPGQQATKPVPVVAAGATGSVGWQVRIDPQASGTFALSARADFDGGRTFSAATDIRVDCPISTPTPTPPTAEPTPTPAAPPMVCAFILRRVPRAVIDAALARPDRVYGWRQPVNPGLPVSPANPLRTQLSVRNIGMPYHPLSNPVLFKAGCP
jgi:hypothetical protein